MIFTDSGLGVGKKHCFKRKQSRTNFSRSYPTSEQSEDASLLTSERSFEKDLHSAKHFDKVSTMAKKKQSKNKDKNSIQKMAISVASKAGVPQKLKAIKRKAGRIEPETIAKGAAAVSIAAGVIAAGAMLSKKSNRQKAGKMAAKGIKIARDMAEEMGNEAEVKSQAIAQSVSSKKNQGSKSRK